MVMISTSSAGSPQRVLLVVFSVLLQHFSFPDLLTLRSSCFKDLQSTGLRCPALHTLLADHDALLLLKQVVYDRHAV